LALDAMPVFCPNGLFWAVLLKQTGLAEATEECVLRARECVTASGGGHVMAAGPPASILGMGLPSNSMALVSTEFR
jgi:hypothetical protein